MSVAWKPWGSSVMDRSDHSDQSDSPAQIFVVGKDAEILTIVTVTTEANRKWAQAGFLPPSELIQRLFDFC